MKVIARKKLREFWEKYRDAEQELKAWFAEAERSQWKTPQDILNDFSYVDIISGNRVVFNIKGNHYRLVVKIHYNTGVVFIRFVGTHNEYDRIDAETI
jgi:mRNA interferase HigB